MRVAFFRGASRAPLGCVFAACYALGACNEGAGGSGADDSTGGADGGPCFEQLPEIPPPGNPEFLGTISGENMPNQRASRVASANIARVANDAACCQDFIVAGGTNLVRVKFAAPYDGLTILADRADETISIGASTRTVLDLAVGDLNADNRNDIVVLRDDKQVVIARAVANPPPNGPYFAATTSITMNVGAVVPGTALDLGDVDADEDLDIFVTSTTDRVLWRKNNGNGTFAGTINSAAGLTTQNLVVANVNAGNQADVLVSGNSGNFAYLRSTGAALAAPVVHQAWAPGSTTTGMLIAAGRFCPGHATATAVAVGAFDIVRVACSDGAGEFADVLEPHGTQAPGNGVVADYEWDDSPGNVSQLLVKDLSVWTPPMGLSELHSLLEGNRVFWNSPGTCEYKSGSAIPVAKWGAKTFTGMTTHREARGDGSWGAVSCAGSLGLLSVH
jgi:hypothetical protein